MTFNQSSLKRLATLFLFVASLKAAHAGTFEGKVLSATIQTTTGGATIADTGTDYVPLSVKATAALRHARARQVVQYEITYTPDAGESVPSTAYVTVGFEDVLQASATQDRAVVCDIADGTTVVQDISPLYFASENGAIYPLGESETQITPTLQSDGTYKATVTVNSNYLEADVPSGSADVATAQQAIYIADCSFSPAGLPGVRQRSLSGSAGATFVKITAITSTSTKPANLSTSHSSLVNIETKDLSGGLYSRASKLTESGDPRFSNHGFGFSAGYVQWSCNIFTTRAATYPTSATVRWSINKTMSLDAQGNFGDPRGAEFSNATVGSIFRTASLSGSHMSYPGKASIGASTDKTITLDSFGGANFVLPDTAVYVPLVSVAGEASVTSTSLGATAYHAARLIVRMR